MWQMHYYMQYHNPQTHKIKNTHPHAHAMGTLRSFTQLHDIPTNNTVNLIKKQESWNATLPPPPPPHTHTKLSLIISGGVMNQCGDPYLLNDLI